MPQQDARLRQDLIENAVQHEPAAVKETVASAKALDSLLNAEVEHDLLVWPPERLETCFDSDSTGRVPLNEARLQGVLEYSFERSEELLRAAIQPPLTDSGVYVGTVIWEGQELLLQRISATQAIVHAKALLSEIPHTGQSVRIAYSNGLGAVNAVALRRPSRELAR